MERPWATVNGRLPPFALIRDDRNQNTRGNVSKISVNQSLRRRLSLTGDKYIMCRQNTLSTKTF